MLETLCQLRSAVQRRFRSDFIGERFRRDTRAIEGLPIRLVIALVVGVASLSVMLNMLSGLGGLAVTELDTRPSPAVVEPGEHTLTITVATVIVKGGSADIDGVRTARTGPDGNATVTVRPELRPNQEEGTLVIDVKPPAGSQFADRRANTRVLVVRESDD
ncbi:MAG: DUF7382 domain-containing protein [Halolamina sp.]